MSATVILPQSWKVANPHKKTQMCADKHNKHTLTEYSTTPTEGCSVVKR